MSEGILAGAAEPDGAPRIPIMDILRGLAILGILFMNINDMGQSLNASFGDIRHLGWAPADQVAWWLREILANGTARCLLEMLFGVGMVILTERFAAAANGWAVLRRYYVRNLVLFLFGVVHMYILLWPGDILHSYGLAALVAVLFRRLRPRWLLTIGLSMALIQLTMGGYFGYYQGLQKQAQTAAIETKQAGGLKLTAAETKRLKDHAKALADRAKREAEFDKQVADEDRGRSGTGLSWMWAQILVSWDRFPNFGEIFTIWEAAGTMLIGAALFKLGIIQGLRSRRYYLGMMLIGYGIGGVLRAIGAWEQTRFDHAPHSFWATMEVARLLMTIGHIGMVHVVMASPLGQRLLKPFAATGRTALSVYIAQTLITLWVIFPPWGLALYGKLSWAPLMELAFAINLALLILSNIYVRYLDIAPVEWAWRSLISWRALPWRKPRQPIQARRAPFPA
ncbi:DUF418 domain-containing protein [Sphingomonas sp. 28-63-12]|uniref:DUF418 domain-containing protein n=1 Tax=Sphingomonas sp. 28-63-12 TaxID=1970434 RepID=UPI000BD63914|nr:MAG: hypothetical protein B7Y47_04500 [Sphingomonas sp. 28-63-12]